MYGVKLTPTLCIGDLHFPFVKSRDVDRVVALVRKLRPKRIVQLGDLYDLYSYTRFARSQNVMTPQREMVSGRRDAERFWREVRAAAGRGVECWQLKGNHDDRPMRQVKTMAPELEHLVERGLKGLWDFDGVETVHDSRQELIIDGVVHMHGYRRHGTHVTFNQANTVVGHLHLGGVVYHQQQKKTLWELNAGYLANRQAVPMSYTQQARFSRSTQGLGWYDEYGPRFIPLE